MLNLTFMPYDAPAKKPLPWGVTRPRLAANHPPGAAIFQLKHMIYRPCCRTDASARFISKAEPLLANANFTEKLLAR